METEKISITRALRELKLLNDRINKTISDTHFLDMVQGRKKDFAFITKKTITEFNETVKSKYQSINDLIERRQNIKRLIMKSNAETIVKISGKDYLVIDAIEKKSSIEYSKHLLSGLKHDRNGINKEIDTNNEKLNQQIDNMVNNSLGTEKKVDENTYNQIANPIIEANEIKMVDPLKIDKEIERLEEEIENFESEVDFVLSESNSQTYIEI